MNMDTMRRYGVKAMTLLHCVQLAVAFSRRSVDDPAIKDYCQSEHFEASCDEEHVILMTHAQYGRMRTGTCITGQYGRSDCALDVLFYMDQKCSGRQSCQVYIADPELHKLNPCNIDLVSYLEAAYRCVKVAWAPADHCHSELTLSSEHTSGFIASDVTVQTGKLGTETCPWAISAPPGQTIEVTLYIFGKGKMADETSAGTMSYPESSQACYELGIITEKRGDSKNQSSNKELLPLEHESKPISTCVATGIREHDVFHSRTNQITVAFKSGHMLHELYPFLLKYEVRGCAEFVAPPGASVEVEGVTAKVACNHTRKTWYLTCVRSQWVGQPANCTADGFQFATEGPQPGPSYSSFPIGVLLIVALGVALGVFLGGVLLTLVAIHMKKRRPKRPPLYHDEYYETYKLKESQQNSQDVKALDPSFYYGLNAETYSPGTHRPYKDCPAHGHLAREALARDHVVQTPDICSEHEQNVGRSEPITLYAANKMNQSMTGKDAYEHLHGGSRELLHCGQSDQRLRPLIE